MNIKENFLKEIAHLKNAFGFAWNGLRAAWSGEVAFRQEIFATIVIIPLAFWLEHHAIARALLIASWLVVPIVELVNTALEAVVDRIGSEIHPLSAKIKDIGSAAVLLSIIQAALVWLILLI